MAEAKKIIPILEGKQLPKTLSIKYDVVLTGFWTTYGGKQGMDQSYIICYKHPKYKKIAMQFDYNDIMHSQA